MDLNTARAAATIAAGAALSGQTPDEPVTPDKVIKLAEALVPWILDYGALLLVVSPLTYEQGTSTSAHTRTSTTPEGLIMATLTDTQQFTASVEPEDSKGFATTDAGLTWSESSGGAVVTLQPSADGMSCLVVAVAPGSATYQVTDGTRTASGAVDVTAGAVAALVITEGTASEQAPPAPPAPAPAGP